MTEFVVSIHRNPIEHRLWLNQVLKWSEPMMRGGPAAVIKRQKVRTLLGARNGTPH